MTTENIVAIETTQEKVKQKKRYYYPEAQKRYKDNLKKKLKEAGSTLYEYNKEYIRRYNKKIKKETGKYPSPYNTKKIRDLK